MRNNFIMQDAKVHRGFIDLTSNRTQIVLLVLLCLLLVGAYLINARQNPEVSPLPKGTVTISQAVLEEKYGLRVSLVAVTAAGGFVDLRLKILDGEKARSLLQDKDNLPSLFADNAVRLHVPAEVKEAEFRFERNSSLFFMVPNTGSTVQQGDKVRIIFGNLALEPIIVQ
jgi:hypothetical protein